MTTGDVFAKISAHQIEGMMFHDNMADYYDFLGLMGFKRMHEYHFLSETAAMRSIHRYFINHYNMLVPESPVDSSSYIPSAWRNYTRSEVEEDAKQNAIKTSIEKWVKWENDTKKLYEQSYSQLCELGEIAAACKIKELICDVDMELKCADRLHIKLKSMNYDMPTIVFMQDELHEKYKKLEDDIGVKIC